MMLEPDDVAELAREFAAVEVPERFLAAGLCSANNKRETNPSGLSFRRALFQLFDGFREVAGRPDGESLATQAGDGGVDGVRQARLHRRKRRAVLQVEELRTSGRPAFRASSPGFCRNNGTWAPGREPRSAGCGAANSRLTRSVSSATWPPRFCSTWTSTRPSWICSMDSATWSKRVQFEIVLAVELLLLIEVEDHQAHGLGGHPFEQRGEGAQEHQAVAGTHAGAAGRKRRGVHQDGEANAARHRRRRVCRRADRAATGRKRSPAASRPSPSRSLRLSLASMVQSLRQARPESSINTQRT